MEDNNPPQPRSAVPQNIVPVAIAFEGGLAAVAIGLGWLMGLDLMSWLPPTPAHAARGLALGALATLPLLAALAICMMMPFGPLARLRRVVDRLVVPLFRDCRIVDMAMIAVLAGLGEEMLFRAVVQQTAAVWFPASPVAAACVGLAASALLFGLAHAITPAYAILAGLIGLYLGAIWIFADYNLLVPVVAHASYDFLALVYLVRIRRPADLP